MRIDILQYAEGAKAARGLAVVIDVFRAFSVACYVFSKGAVEIIAAGGIDRALELKRRYPDAVLIGERHARKLDGFDFGNSPSAIDAADLSGKRVIHTTHAGTQALVAAGNADDVLTGSFVNAGAIIKYIRAAAPDTVSLVCAGFEGRTEAAEDTLCARYIRDALNGRTPTTHGLRETLSHAPSARRFFDPADTASPLADLDLCLALDRFDFVIRKVQTEADACRLSRIDL